MGKSIPLSNGRRAIAAMLEYARKIPTVPVSRAINVAALAQARGGSVDPVSWTAIFIRAYGIVCKRFPELRRSWISWPYPHLYEHSSSKCAVAVEREWEGEKIVLMGLIREPESSSLLKIHRDLLDLKNAEIWSVSSFRATLRFGSMPRSLQRFILWHKLDISGPRRVKHLGTFGISNYGSFGAESLHPIGLQTTLLTLSPIEPNGAMNAKLVYDHRVLDGSFIARCLVHLDEVLHDVILAELRQSMRIAA